MSRRSRSRQTPHKEVAETSIVPPPDCFFVTVQSGGGWKQLYNGRVRNQVLLDTILQDAVTTFHLNRLKTRIAETQRAIVESSQQADESEATSAERIGEQVAAAAARVEELLAAQQEEETRQQEEDAQQAQEDAESGRKLSLKEKRARDRAKEAEHRRRAKELASQIKDAQTAAARVREDAEAEAASMREEHRARLTRLEGELARLETHLKTCRNVTAVDLVLSDSGERVGLGEDPNGLAIEKLQPRAEYTVVSVSRPGGAEGDIIHMPLDFE